MDHNFCFLVPKRFYGRNCMVLFVTHKDLYICKLYVLISYTLSIIFFVGYSDLQKNKSVLHTYTQQTVKMKIKC